MEAVKRHVMVYTFFQGLWALRSFLRRKFNYSCEKAPELSGSYIVLANHNTDWDPLLVAQSFPRHMYFVASEHIFRKGFLTRLLRRYLDPISRIKGGNAATTVLEIIRRLRRGNNVCIFAEGNRSFNGLTGQILPSTGKLVKASGAALITYRLEGGYFTSPRWSYTLRRGRMKGYCKNVYSAEQLKAMSVEEINAAIAGDLYEDAYANQQQEPVEYLGKRLAEGMEHALFICPGCGKVGSLHSNEDHLSCECGLSVRYSVTGQLSGGPFSTITEWDAWQHGELEKLADKLTSAPDSPPAFFDEDISLVRLNEAHEAVEAARGRLCMYRDRLTVGDTVIPMESITDFSIHGRSIALFSTGTVHYELQRAATYCGRKYVELYKLLK